MLQTRDLQLIIGKQIHTWLSRSVLALGDKDGPGGTDVGMMRIGPRALDVAADTGKIGKYFHKWKPTAPKFEPTHVPELGLVPGAVDNKIISNSEAVRLVKLVGARLKLRSMTKLNAGIGKKGGYRHWLAGEVAGTFADSGLGQALKDIQSAELKPWSELSKRNRTRFGPQMISTSRARRTLPIGKPFLFGGQTAHRNPVGRPALSAADWELRYRLRLMARRKTNKPGHRTGVTIPPTRYARP